MIHLKDTKRPVGAIVLLRWAVPASGRFPFPQKRNPPRRVDFGCGGESGIRTECFMWKKSLIISHFFVFVSIFVSILNFVVKKRSECFGVSGYVLLGNVGVDFTHGLIV